jgi:4-hydroxy-tetrahydrodipicolinate reductase
MSTPKAALRVAVTGANGRVGRLLCELIGRAPHLELAQAVGRQDTLDPSAADVVVDFSQPAATAHFGRQCGEAGTPFVTGTTGLADGEFAALEEASQRAAVLVSPNMSLGVNALFALVELAASALGGDADIEIVEAHHRHKKDAPSGTAVRLLEGVARARGLDPHTAQRSGRSGWVGERSPHEIGVFAVRGGDTVGEHTVSYFLQGERLELIHRATDRAIFARGALRAAEWLVGKPAGMYSMAQVLGLASR